MVPRNSIAEQFSGLCYITNNVYFRVRLISPCCLDIWGNPLATDYY